MINDGLKITGAISFTLNGEVIQEIPNLVVTTGKNWVAQRMIAASEGVMSHIELGSSSAAEGVGDAVLVNIITGSRKIANTTSSTNTVSYETTWGTGDGAIATITEAGIFNAASAGTMLARKVFPEINKGANDTLTITWTITIS
jgi:hypothetical protein